ncbi:hypothetical protein SK854_30130 [Lentzea sp. BCCO 10_0061]|uniref:Uncharacterized protein n=1 Tax=Lentzea sokolovensis TaxID=3095429 RepID=A0ABU4V3N5_9PSEU|nr:hypothetical protein [Lentzea sp. BCCO 10_0061]MDX8146406.1 hypothetical protein [Lentzea sp. BCCO 10_0061]
MFKTTFVASPLTALRLAEEQACAGYLDARKALVSLAARVASLTLLVGQYPARADYRKVLGEVMGNKVDAELRTGLAWRRYQNAQVRADAFWAASNKAGAPVLVAA